MARLVALVIAAVMSGSTAGARIGAQDVSDSATVAVCAGLGGDALSLVSWTAEEIRAAEARSGGPLPRAHPETGTCEDPSGLPVLPNAASAFSLVCRQAADGWYGPVWTANVYLDPTQAPVRPDPTTGGCPLPRSRQVSPPPEAERAAAIAVYLSQLEAGGDFAEMYRWLHPDAQAIVPPEVVVGWYAEEWAPRGAGPIAVDRVRFVDWTWGVTGETYPDTAEVAFHQPFADGSVAEDVVRLARTRQGGWRWFFGRDRAFVEEQSARYGAD